MKERIARYALAVALGVAAASTRLEAAPSDCYTIQPGDTAAQVARRLTGDAERRHEPWFQIIDPAASRMVPKAGYGRILPGWRACIAVRWITTEAAPVSRERAGSRAQRLLGEVTRALAAMHLPIAWWWAALAVLVAAFAGQLAGRYWHDRQAAVATMTRFGERFVREFERPLARRGASHRSVRSRLRVMPQRGRIDILLAPNEGRSYPNLSDHKANVEYDVGRVLGLLRDEPFVAGELYARERWVVVPCRLRVLQQEEGDR